MGKKKAVNVGPAFANIHRLSTRRKQNEDQTALTSCAAMGDEKSRPSDKSIYKITFIMVNNHIGTKIPQSSFLSSYGSESSDYEIQSFQKA